MVVIGMFKFLHLLTLLVIVNNAETAHTFEIANQRFSELLPLKAKGNLKYACTHCTDKIFALTNLNDLTLIKVIGRGTFEVSI